MTAGSNDPGNPASNVWGGRLLFGLLKDGVPWVPTHCQLAFYDKNGGELQYSVFSRESKTTNQTSGLSAGGGPGTDHQFDLSSPWPSTADSIGGPMMFYCRSSDLSVLRNKILAVSSLVLYSPQGLKLAEVAEPLKFTSSYRWAFPLVEGGDGQNWEHTGIAITNTTTRQNAPNGVTVRISITDQYDKAGPYRDITLNPPQRDIGPMPYNILPGETKVYALWTLFGESPVEGNALFAPYGNRTKRAQLVHGTVTVESLDPSTTIAVFATRMFGETGLTAVPVRPVPAP
jgi:hypothetical protein